jgi:hypothetical protein
MTRQRRWSLAIPIAVAALLSVVGCSSSGSPIAGSPGLAGSAESSESSAGGSSTATGTIGGTLKVTGGPPSASSAGGRAVSGEVYVFASDTLTGAVVAKARTRADGTFAVQVPPGTYYLAATSPSFVLDPAPTTPPCRGDRAAAVTTGSVTLANVTCAAK